MQRTHEREFKLALCKRIKDGELAKGRACREYQLSNGLLDRWLEQYEAKGDKAFTGQPWRIEATTSDVKIELLEQEVRQLRLELAFARKLIQEKKSR